MAPIDGIWRSNFVALCLSSQHLQRVELLVVKLSPTAHPSFCYLAQPFRAIAGCVDSCPGYREFPSSGTKPSGDS